MLYLRWYVSFLVVCFILTMGSMIFIDQTFHKRKTFRNESSTTHSKNLLTLKPFVYLTQTEQCLPLNLADSIGNTTCNCDVIVLSYQVDCNKTTNKPPSHVTYMFEPRTTWNTGRNALYLAALNRTPGYHYYIFLDDDAKLIFNDFAPPEMKTIQPFRVFQEWLLDYEPAIGVLDYTGHHGARWTLDRRKELCSIYNTSLVLPVVWFDAIFNAFHYRAIAHILPYNTEYDNENWWLSQIGVIAAVELKFRGQALMFAAVSAVNPKHRKYPQHMKQNTFTAAFEKYVEEIHQEAPTRYHNHTIFKEFKENPVPYTSSSLTYCMSVSRHHSIAPYAHFDHHGLN